MKQNCKTLVIGAGFAALGYALSHPDCLIAEPSELVGGSYAGLFRPAQPFKEPAKTPEGKMFSGYLSKSGVLDERGRFDILSLSPYVYAYTKEHGLPVLLQAHFVNTRHANGEYVTELYTNSGCRIIRSKYLLDTTSHRVSAPDTVKLTSKKLHVLCHNPCEDFLQRLQSQDSSCVAVPGFQNGEWIVTFVFLSETSLSQARKTVNDTWLKAFHGAKALIDGIGCDFDREAEPLQKGNAQEYQNWLPDCRFANPVAALDAGAGFTINKQ